MPVIVRLTLFKISTEEKIKAATTAYSSLARDAKKVSPPRWSTCSDAPLITPWETLFTLHISLCGCFSTSHLHYTIAVLHLKIPFWLDQVRSLSL